MMMNLFYDIDIFWNFYFRFLKGGCPISLYLYRIKGKWTIRQPFSLIYIYDKYFMAFIYYHNLYFRFLKGGCPMSLYLYRIKGKWTIEQPLTFYIYMSKNFFVQMSFDYICVYYIWSFLLPSEEVPAFAGGAGLGVV